MSWQEDLRQLDADRDAGRITTHEHQRRRDDILAAASGSGPVRPIGGWPPLSQHTEPAPLPQPAPPTAPTAPTAPTPAAPTRMPLHTAPLMHGSDVFLRNGPKRRSWPTVLVTIGAVILIGFAVWWLGIPNAWLTSGGSSTSTAGSASTSATPVGADNSAESVRNRMPALPGEATARNVLLSVDQVAEIGVLPSAETDALKRNSVRQVAFSGSHQGAYYYTAAVAVATDPATAARTTKDLRDTLYAAGCTNATQGALPRAVTVLKLLHPQLNQYQAVYTSANLTVRITVVQLPAAGDAELASEFDRAGSQVLAAFPAR